MSGYVNDFEEAGIIGVLNYVDPALAVVERYGPPVIIRTLIYDGFRMLDDFARKYRGHVGKVMDHVCMELHGLLHEVLGGE
jgi:hypothetical protein